MQKRALTGDECRNLTLSQSYSFAVRSLKTRHEYQYKVESDLSGTRFVSIRGRVIAGAGYHYLGVLSDDGHVVSTSASPYAECEEVVQAATYALRHMTRGVVPAHTEVVRLSGSLTEQKTDAVPTEFRRREVMEALCA